MSAYIVTMKSITFVGLFISMTLAAPAPYEPILLAKSENKNLDEQKPLEPNSVKYEVKSIQSEDDIFKSPESEEQIPNLKPESLTNPEESASVTNDSSTNEWKDEINNRFSNSKPDNDMNLDSNLQPLLFKCIAIRNSNKIKETKDGEIFNVIEPGTNESSQRKSFFCSYQSVEDENKKNDAKIEVGPPPSELQNQNPLTNINSGQSLKDDFSRNFNNGHIPTKGAFIELSGTYKYTFKNGETEEISYKNTYDKRPVNEDE